MYTKTTIVMLAAVLGLLALLLLAGKTENGGEQDETGPLIADFGQPDVTTITWEAGSGEVTVSRAGDSDEDWVMQVGDGRVPASGPSVEEVLNELSGCRVKKRLAAEEVTATNRQEFGLDPAVAHLDFTMRDRDIAVSFGTEGLSRDTVYAARKGSDDVLLVTDDLLDTLREMTPEKIRNKKFTELSVYDVGEVTVATPDGVRFDAARKEEDRTIWAATVPFRGELDPQVMEGDFLPAILRTEAVDFVADNVPDEDLEKYGLDAPRYRVTITKRSGEGTRTLLVGADVPEKDGFEYFMAEGEPFVYSARLETLLGQLSRDPLELRDRNLTRLGLKVVGKVDAKLDDVAFEMVKDDESWRLEEPERMDLDADAVESWREEVRNLQILEFLPDPDLAALGLEEPRGSLAFWGAAPEAGHDHDHATHDEEKERELVVRILIGGPAGDAGNVYAMRDGDAKTAYVVGPELVELLRTGHYRFKGREIFDVDLGAQEVTGLLRRVEEEDLSIEKEEGAWPEGINANSITPLVRRLLDLRAVRWVGRAEGHEEEYGLGAEPYLRLEVSLRKRDDEAAEPNAFGVVVGAETEGGRYARAIREGVPGQDVFVIAKTALDEKNLTRSVRKVEPEKPTKEEGGAEQPKEQPAARPGEEPKEDGGDGDEKE